MTPDRSSTLYAVVGHRRTDFPLWTGWQFSTANPELSSDFPLSDPGDPRLPDSLIGEYHYLFRLNRELKKTTRFDSIRIAQYRRIVVNVEMGDRAENQPWTRVVSADVARDLDAQKLTEPKDHGFLVSSIFPMPSVLAQYASSHPSRDILRFLADAVDAGIVNDQDATSALLVNGLIPAPSNGTFPINCFTKIMDTLERAAIQFVSGGFMARSDYQRRSVGFCLERLNSYLLLKELAAKSVDLAAVMGQQLTISDQTRVTVSR